VAPRLILVALVALAVIATGCGGSASNGYRAKVASVQKTYGPQIASAQVQLSHAIANQQPAIGARAAASQSALETRARGQIAALHAPTALAVRSARLVTAYGELVQALDQLASALQARAPKRANVAIGRVNDARLDETSAIAALNAD
jgi:hypothetical protein